MSVIAILRHHLGNIFRDSFDHPSDETAKDQSAAVPHNEMFNPMVRRMAFAALCGAGFTPLLSLTLQPSTM
jgi:hypothetical protein